MLENNELECLQRRLGSLIILNREKQGLTQSELAERSKISVRTIIKIESDGGNPTLEVLYPLVRALNIDPRDLFYPERKNEDPEIQELRTMIDQCDDKDHARILKAVAKELKNHSNIQDFFFLTNFRIIELRFHNRCIKNEPAHPFIRISRLCVYASGSLLNTILKSITFTRNSVLHFGQKSGKLISTVFFRTFVLVLPLHCGQCTHFQFTSMSSLIRFLLRCVKRPALKKYTILSCTVYFGEEDPQNNRNVTNGRYFVTNGIRL